MCFCHSTKSRFSLLADGAAAWSCRRETSHQSGPVSHSSDASDHTNIQRVRRLRSGTDKRVTGSVISSKSNASPTCLFCCGLQGRGAQRTVFSASPPGGDVTTAQHRFRESEDRWFFPLFCCFFLRFQEKVGCISNVPMPTLALLCLRSPRRSRIKWFCWQRWPTWDRTTSACRRRVWPPLSSCASSADSFQTSTRRRATTRLTPSRTELTQRGSDNARKAYHWGPGGRAIARGMSSVPMILCTHRVADDIVSLDVHWTALNSRGQQKMPFIFPNNAALPGNLHVVCWDGEETFPWCSLSLFIFINADPNVLYSCPI